MDLWKKIYSFLFIILIISYSKVIGSTFLLTGLICATSLIFLIYPFLLIPESFFYFFYLYHTNTSIIFDGSIFYLTTFVLIVYYSVFFNSFDGMKSNKKYLFLKNLMFNPSVYTANITLNQSKNLNSIIKNRMVIKKKYNHASIAFLEKEFDDIANLYDRLINTNYYSAKFIDYIFTHSLNEYDKTDATNIKVIDCISDAVELYQPLHKQIEIKIDEDFHAFASKFHITYLIACIFNIALSSGSKVYISKAENSLIIEIYFKNKDINKSDIKSLKKIYRGISFETNSEVRCLFKIDFNKRYAEMSQVLANKLKA